MESAGQAGCDVHHCTAFGLACGSLAIDEGTAAEIMNVGATILRPDEVMEGVAEMLHEVQVEATFPDGTKLVTVHDPLR